MNYFSLRESLIKQGVNNEAAMKGHLAFIQATLERNPSMDIRAYRVGNNPNEVPNMG